MICIACGITITRNKEFDNNDEDALLRHIEIVHLKTVPKRSGRRCPLCHKTTYNLRFHLIYDHHGMDLEAFCHAIALGVKP